MIVLEQAQNRINKAQKNKLNITEYVRLDLRKRVHLGILSLLTLSKWKPPVLLQKP